MPKQFNLKINQFDKGFNTEASPLNFPEGASVDECNLLIAPNGTRERRLGLEFENQYALVSLGYTEKELEDAIVSYVDWENAMNNPDLHVGCVVVRDRVFFFDMNTPNPSANMLNRGSYIILHPGMNARVHGAYINGFLVLTSSVLEYPIYLEYDVGQDLVSATDIKLKIRDLQGVDDGLPLRTRPTTLSLEHKYNLINQGWTDSIETVPDGVSEIQFIEAFRGVGGTSGNVTWGGVTWWQDEHNDDIPIGAVNNKIFRGCKYPATAARVGSQLHITFDPRDGARPQYDFEQGRCLWNGCAIYSGRIQAGSTTPYADVHSYLMSKLGVYASNCDIVSLGLVPDGDSLYYNKFSIDTFQKNTGYLNLGEAPKGHIIIDAKNRNISRNNVVPGVASDYDTGSVSVCCGHAGRVFYAGVQGETINPDARTINSHSLVYFTQIITDKTKLERCYQENDPTDQRQFELAAGDGGTIFIPGCANVIALKSYGTSVIVFSEFGVWEITGGDAPFAATSYSVNKVTDVSCISPYSIVEVEDSILFWAVEGIYVMSRNEYGHIVTQNITKETVQTLYAEIPEQAKRGVKSCYDPIKGQIRWLYSLAIEGKSPHVPPLPDISVVLDKSALYNLVGVEMSEGKMLIGTFSGPFLPSPGVWYYIVKGNDLRSLQLTSDIGPSTRYSALCKVDEKHALFLYRSTVLGGLTITCRKIDDATDVHTEQMENLFSTLISSNNRLAVASLGDDTYAVFIDGYSQVGALEILIFTYTLNGGFSAIKSQSFPGEGGFFVSHLWKCSNNMYLIGNASGNFKRYTYDDQNQQFTSTTISLDVNSLPSPIQGSTKSRNSITQSTIDPDVFYVTGFTSNTQPRQVAVWRVTLPSVGASFNIDSTYMQEIPSDLPIYGDNTTNRFTVTDSFEDSILVIGSGNISNGSTFSPAFVTELPDNGLDYTPTPTWEDLTGQTTFPTGVDADGITCGELYNSVLLRMSNGRLFGVITHNRISNISFKLATMFIRGHI